MPYQRSTQASGFRNRTGPDTSKQLRQYATALDKERKANVGEMERQGVQLTNEMTRIDSLATKKDVYELQNLRNFSKTLNNFLDKIATDVVKPVFDQQIEDGVTLGVKYQQGDPDAIDKIKINDKQLKEIEEKVRLQELKVAQSTEAIQNNWDKNNYKASLEEEYRLLNIRKLGYNKAFGFRKGILMESAVGWDAYRDSSLLYNEDNPTSLLNIGTEDDPIIIGYYHRYTGESGREKKKAILGYLTNEYIKEKGKESGLSELFINKYLTRPILEQNAKFQQQEALTARLEQAAAASESNKAAIDLGIDGIDADNGVELEAAIQQFILTEPSNQRGMNTAGSKVVNSNDLLVEHIIGEASKLRTGSHANIDDQEDILTVLETATFEVPGITKKGEKKTLSELWPTKFNMDDIRAKLLVETGKKEADRITAAKNKALGEKVTILQAYHKDRDINNYREAVSLMKNNPEYMGILDGKFFEDMKAERDTLSYNKKTSKIKLNEIRQGYDNNPIPSDHAIVSKLHPDVLKEAEEKGWIAADLFGGDNEAKASHNSNAKSALATIKNGMETHSPSFKWDDENDQITKANALIDSTLRKYTKQFLDLNESNENYSLSDAVSDAYTQLDKEIKADIAGEVLPTANGGVRASVWGLQDDGFKNTALNTQYETTATSPIDQAKRIRSIIDNTSQKIKLSHHVDIFSDPDQKPVVAVDDFVLVDGKVSQIWQQLSQIDPLGRSPEMLYTIQASKFPGIEVPEWGPKEQAEIELWNKLNPKLRIQLSSGNFTAGKRAMQEIGVLDLDSTINSILTNQGDNFIISEEELPSILNALNLDSMTLDELKANPQLLKLAMKKKILNITEQVQAVTTDQNQALRMIFAGIKFGDINKWNDPYTLAALNSYYSGDRSALDKLESTFNMNPYEKPEVSLQDTQGINIFADQEISWDINSIDTEIKTLTDNMPPKFTLLESKMEDRNWIQNTFAPIKQANPQYLAYQTRLQQLNDRKLFIKYAEKGFELASEQTQAIYAGRRLMGDKRFKELQQLVLAKYPDAKINSKTNIIGASYKDATNMLGVLILNEIGAPGSTGSIVGDTSGDLTFDISEYTLDSPLSGNIPKEDLVEIKGYTSSGSGEVIQVRQDVAIPLENMLDDAAKQGILLNFSSQKTYNSGFRPLDQQIAAKESMIKAGTPELAAEPGRSTHGLGTGFDFYIEDEATLNWLKENGPKYGFFPYSKEGTGKPDFNLQLGQNDEHWHWDYRPELMENN